MLRQAGKERVEILGIHAGCKTDTKAQHASKPRHGRVAGQIALNLRLKTRQREGLASRVGLGEVRTTDSTSREMIYVASSFSVARLHQSAVIPSVTRCTNHHRHRSRLRQGSEWDGGGGRAGAGHSDGDWGGTEHDHTC